MQHGRQRLVGVISGLTPVTGLGLVSSSPAAAEPTLEEVEPRVDTLHHEAEIASERYHDARLKLTKLTEDLDALESDQVRQDQRLEAVREQVRDTVLRRMQGDNLSAVGQVVVSDDPQSFVTRMSTMSAFNQLQRGMFTDHATELNALGLRSTTTEPRAGEVEAVERRLQDEKDATGAKGSAAEELIADLEGEERERLAAEQAAKQAAAEAAAAERAQVAVSRSRNPGTEQAEEQAEAVRPG